MKYKRIAMPNSWRSEWQICQSCASKTASTSNGNGSQMFSFHKKKLNVFISFMVPARGQLGVQLETCELQLLD